MNWLKRIAGWYFQSLLFLIWTALVFSAGAIVMLLSIVGALQARGIAL